MGAGEDAKLRGEGVGSYGSVVAVVVLASMYIFSTSGVAVLGGDALIDCRGILAYHIIPTIRRSPVPYAQQGVIL